MPRVTEKINILGVNIDAINLTLACDKIEDWIQTDQKTYICVVPVSTLVQSRENEFYRSVINHAGMATPDGMPLVWLGKKRGFREIERTYGPDLMLAVCERSKESQYKHFFYGGAPQVIEALEFKLKEKFPSLHVVGRYSPPFSEECQEEKEEVLNEINRASPDILWVGLGSPKQDIWMHMHRPKLRVPVMMGVGAAFDFLSGVKRQAPRWMQKAGLEWLFRLACEPKRLWKRYMIGNAKFIWYLTKDGLNNIL